MRRLFLRVSDVTFFTVMTVSLAEPVVALTREIAQSVNASHFNLTEISERIRPAIEQTLLAAEKVKRTLCVMCTGGQ